ncbi:hypothetical protein [Nocardia transvalensis]|uniref:hypothetical protein n=1 Tax=Nocardia transvalensis TaxID=37333 RepID=UPI0018944774|nr:hypothetical protein [Nocardia transvalensis]MBF6327786.1 hypothetical protein [Nocardia transvalensis]
MAHRQRFLSPSFAVALLTAALAAAGCEQAKEAVNKGGDTPCSEFIKQDQDKQRVTVRKYLEQDSQLTTTPDPGTVDNAIAAIQLMCSAQANPDTPIRKADLTGILVPK